MDDRGAHLIKMQEQLESDRSTLDSHWGEIAERVLPHENNFRQTRTPGQKLMDKVFDSTAISALWKFASAINSLVTPSSQVWHGLGPEDDDLAEDLEVKAYLEQVTKVLFRMRYRPFANFAGQISECWVNSGAFGTNCIFVEDVLGRGVRYASIPMAELYIRQSAHGVVDYVHRKFEYEVRQMIQRFGRNAVPEQVRKFEEINPFQKFEVIHCVKPNEERKPGERSYRGMAFSSYYIVKDFRHTLEEGGYRTFPYPVGRYATASKEVYGRSPAMQVLPDVKMLNEMEKTLLRAAHKQVDPPLLAYGDGILSAFNARPNAVNYGGVSERGEQLVHALNTGGRLPIGLEMSDQRRKTINDAFLVTLFQILVENPQMTATEALLRSQEKGALLAPTMGRQQSELIGAMVSRELDIASTAGIIPPPPQKLRDAGNRVKAVYTSPLSRLMRAEDAVAIVRTLETIKPIAEIKPEVLDIFEDDGLVREIAEIHGVPARILRTPEKVMAIRQQRSADQQEAAAMEQAQQAAMAAKNAAQATSVMSQIPTEEGEVA